MEPPSNITDIYKSQGWNDDVAIKADIAAGGWKGKVPQGNTSGINYQPPSSLDFAKQAQAPIDESFKQYAMGVRAQAKPIDIFTQMEEQAGLPQQRKVAATLREGIGNLEDTIKGVKAQVEGTSRESLLTESQRQQLVTAKQQPLLERLSEISTSLGRAQEGITAASQDIAQRTSLVMQGQDRETQLYAKQLDMETDKAARLQTAFDKDSENELQMYLTQLQRGWQLEDKDVERAFTLMLDEQDYNQVLTQQRIKSAQDLESYEAKKKIDWQYKPAGIRTDTGTDISQYYTTTQPVTFSPEMSGLKFETSPDLSDYEFIPDTW